MENYIFKFQPHLVG